MSPAVVNDFPIQTSKIKCPSLREQTLARGRLLEWLEAKIHHRLVFVTAEAGYGKTTLLADFSRRTRLRTLWYRLDETDRDWVTVLNHLVAAGRIVDPDFAPATWSLLGELGGGGAPMSTIVATYIRELQVLGERGAALILDDYHVVEDEPDIQYIFREIVAHASDRLTIVISSRRQPMLPVARLRTLGEVSELTRDDLRFEPGETEQLFRETYGRPLEPDVLIEIDRRTNGWVASLQLVQSALRERSMAEARTFIQTLSGARGSLHDYLAEEVVGDLDPALQAFLMRTAVLSSLTVELAAFTARVPTDEARRLLDEAARVGLLPRSEIAVAARYHPLVRDFLEDRLRREIGESGVADLHRDLARYGEINDWKLAAHHFAAAGDFDDVHRVLVDSIQDIMGTGGFALAESYVRRYPEFESEPAFGIFLSRGDLNAGDFARAAVRAQSAVDAFPPRREDHLSHLAIANLSTVRYSIGDIVGAVERAQTLRDLEPERELREIANGVLSISHESVDGDLAQSEELLQHALLLQVERGHHHYAGITHLNLASNLQAQGRASQSLAHATEAVELLSSTSAGFEIATAHLLRAWALLHLGHLEDGVDEMAVATAIAGPDRRAITVECADLEAAYGDPSRAERMLTDSVGMKQVTTDEDDLAVLVLAELAQSPERVAAARELLLSVNPNKLRAVPAYAGRWSLAAARMDWLAGTDASLRLEQAERYLRTQGASHWMRCLEIVAALIEGDPTRLNAVLSRVLEDQSAYASVCADDLAPRLGSLDTQNLHVIQSEARARPNRWRPALRRMTDSGNEDSSLVSAALLDEIGEAEDIPRLRTFARSNRSAAAALLGRGLARRLAPVAYVHDQGHVGIRIGSRDVDGSGIRRKVLSLICFLVTRPSFAATRDQVLDALWPDLDPGVAVNSLNQTVYFLRRVFEPAYREDDSANYVAHDGEVVRLDTFLVTSQTATSLRLVEKARASLDPQVVEELSVSYSGRFAIDFEYEDWASPFRETLHAGYLDVIEQAILSDTASGHFDRAGLLARRALSVDPEASSIEFALLRMYRNSGSHSAAAEQYSHYAAVAQNDGFEPPPLAGL